MTKQKSGTAKGAEVRIYSEVARHIRQHAHSSSNAEICGVLIGAEREGTTLIEASIQGSNAVEGGTHVTFTQDTWEHIYRIKDRDFPDARIMGWYHSHPGFGVFLSDHDTFIHKNFFSAPGQVAWVCDPLSDEEGCFGWVGGRLERLSRIVFCDEKAGEEAGETGKPEPVLLNNDQETASNQPPAEQFRSELLRTVGKILLFTVVFFAGILLSSYYFFTHYLLVPVDPHTGQPLILAQPEPGGETGGSRK